MLGVVIVILFEFSDWQKWQLRIEIQHLRLAFQDKPPFFGRKLSQKWPKIGQKY
jgi:hypothetical protein